MATVRNMVSPRTDREVANQFIIELNHDGKEVTVFQSYKSDIATIDWVERDITIGDDWDYSRTTGKYRNQFFEEMGFDALSSKKGIEDALKLGYVEHKHDYINFSVHFEC